MKTNLILLFLVFSGLFIACTGNHSASDSKDAGENNVQIKSDTIADIYARYVQLKDALVNSDPKAASAAAAGLADALDDIKGCEITTETAKTIGNSADLKVQRAKFLPLSADIIPMVKSTSVSSGSIFVLYCPMADGYWMSSNKTVRNPYYGEEMMDCGEVKEEIN